MFHISALFYQCALSGLLHKCHIYSRNLKIPSLNIFQTQFGSLHSISPHFLKNAVQDFWPSQELYFKNFFR